MENKAVLARMKELIITLNSASKAYYQDDREIMSNYEYDSMSDELQALEKETGIILSDSPSIKVGYEAVDSLPKEDHASPMLSLDKTKEREELRAFIGDHRTLLSWKMDGLTIVLTYQNGSLSKAVTRGNGITGEVVTNNAMTFKNLPRQIPYKGELVLRGEAIITYSDFEKINEEIPEADARYKNPRNLCSGSVRQLNNQITAERNVRFYAFALVSAPGVDFNNSRAVQFEWLTSQGFQVVEYRVVENGAALDEALDYFAQAVASNDFPSDGLVALYDDIAYGDSLGSTAKFPRNAYAFKWADETRTTRLIEVEWSPSRTGLINPVAIFEPVELEGTTVSRASVHNVSIVKELALGIGDEIDVYKANMIIPQIAKNHTMSGNLKIPDICPACGGKARIRAENEVEALYCVNPDCPAKKIKSFALFVSRDAMNIEGMSEATLEKLIAHGYIHEFADLFRLKRYSDEIAGLDGFGEKSCKKLLGNIDAARNTTPSRVIYALGIPGVGSANAKLLCRFFDQDISKLRAADTEEISSIESIGPVIAANVKNWFEDENNIRKLDELLSEISVAAEAEQGEKVLSGLTFVITGSVAHFANRSELKEKIESLGGKVTGSVTKKTNYLINNDTSSGSSKNRKAAELGIRVISEEDFMSMI